MLSGSKIQSTSICRGAVFFCMLIATVSVYAIDPGHPHGITSDGSTGTTVSGAVDYTVGGGDRRGGNLFHSFGKFNVHGGESVTFSDGGITNLIIRVTGPDYSWLNGQINSSADNIYIINAQGMITGNSAVLNTGSFHGSTADYIRLGDGTDRYYCDLGQSSSFTAAPPEAFGFLDSGVQDISIDGSQFTVPDNKTMSFIGGDLSIENNAVIDNDGGTTGRINLAGVASAGEVVVTGTGLTVSSFSTFGTITLEAGSELRTDILYTAGDVTVGGNWNVSAGDYQAMSPSTVTFSGAALQNIYGTNSFDHLILNNANGFQLNSEVVVEGTFTLGLGLFTLGTGHLRLGPSATVAGTPSAAAMVVATGSGEMRKTFAGTGSFVFPVGDNDGTAEYSPVGVNFTSGAFGGGNYVGVRLTDAKHPNTYFPGDHLTRYWTIIENAITGFSCDVTCQYVDADVTTIEANIAGAKYEDPTWTFLNLVNDAANTFSGTVSSFSDFSGVHSTYVTGTTPVKNTHSASTSTNMTATYTVNLNVGTVSDATFMAHAGFDGRILSTEGAWSGSTNTATLNPNSDFHPGELIQMTGTKGIESAGGTAAIPHVWQFRTAVSQGWGTFFDSGQTLGSYISCGVSLGDVDGDGDLDAFVANYDEPNRVWVNQGGAQAGTAGKFFDSGQTLGSSISRGVYLGDVDGDGDLDAFVANQMEANRVWVNQGGLQGGTPGQFIDSGQTLGTFDTSLGIFLGDVDGEGDLDALVVN